MTIVLVWVIPARILAEKCIASYILMSVDVDDAVQVLALNRKASGMKTKRTRDEILSDIRAIPTMERGKLCTMKRKGGGNYHNLQFWNQGRNQSTYISKQQLAVVSEAVDNYVRFRELVSEYAGLVEEQTRTARKAATAKKGALHSGRGSGPKSANSHGES